MNAEKEMSSPRRSFLSFPRKRESSLCNGRAVPLGSRFPRVKGGGGNDNSFASGRAGMTKNKSRAIVLLLLLALIAAPTIAACGKKPQDVDPPTGEATDFPRKYPEGAR